MEARAPKAASRAQEVGQLILTIDVRHPPAAFTDMQEELAAEQCLHVLSLELSFSPTG
jgi:hypothetical protein